MGRKLKQMVYLGIVLVLLYWQQYDGVSAAEGRRRAAELEVSGSGETDPGEMDPEKTDPGEPDPEEPEKEVVCFQVSYSEPDGKAGYYRSKPEINLLHVSEAGITRYRYTDGEGGVLEGVLEASGESVQIGTESSKEGENHLSVWMEDEEGKQIEEYTLEQTFLIDTVPPSLQVTVPRGEEAWYQKEVMLYAQTEDGSNGSGAVWISCVVGEQEIGSSGKAQAGFLINRVSLGGKAVPAAVRVWDQAGNQTQKNLGLFIDALSPGVEIEGIQSYTITSRPVEVTYKVTEENVLAHAYATAEREDPDGRKTEIPTDEWIEGEDGQTVRQTLTEDGIYQVRVAASDQASHHAESSVRFIIDQQNPVIHYIDRLDQRYLKSFQWEYPAQDWIKDFTSYTYTMFLDGRLYPIGEEVTAEGRHVLEAKAVDAAGNVGTARAAFVIDHTPPKPVFKDVQDGSAYEEEKTFQVTLEDQQDRINEIRINGEKQPVSDKSKIYQYTVQECRSYEVLVKASDRAGNQSTSYVRFTVEPKVSVIERVLEPVKKTLGIQEKGERLEKKDERTGGTSAEGITYLILAGVLAAVVVIWKTGIWRRQ